MNNTVNAFVGSDIIKYNLFEIVLAIFFTCAGVWLTLELLASPLGISNDQKGKNV